MRSNTISEWESMAANRAWLECPGCCFLLSARVTPQTIHLTYPSLHFTMFVLYRSTISPEENNYKLSPWVSQDKKLASSQATRPSHQVRLFPDTIKFIKALIAISLISRALNLAYEIEQPPLLSMRNILKRLLCPAAITIFAQSVARGRTD